MAYVTQFAPQDFCSIPKFGTIQFHPSLLPLHRGASSMSWAIICGRTETGFSIFRPTDGLDEGPVILIRSVPIEPEDTLGSLYFGKIFPMGVAALVEVAEQVVAGKAPGARAVRTERRLRGHHPRRGNAHQLGEPRRYHLQPDPRLRSRARRLDHGRWQEAVRVQRTKRIARTFAEVKGKKLGEVVASTTVRWSSTARAASSRSHARVPTAAGRASRPKPASRSARSCAIHRAIAQPCAPLISLFPP